MANATCINDKLSVAIDIGHSPQRGGATSAHGTGEYHFNKNIAELLYKRLLLLGFKNSFITTQSNPEMPLHARASLASAKQADLFISIHHDSVHPKYLKEWEYKGKMEHYSDDFQGFSMFVSKRNKHLDQSMLFAELLGDELLQLDFTPSLHHQENIPGENRPLLNKEKGIYQYDELVVLRRAKVPAILLECGIIVNKAESAKLSQRVYQHLLVSALERALLRFATFPSSTNDYEQADPKHTICR